MKGLAVIVPTRSRPEAVLPLAAAFADTCRERHTDLVFVVDDCPRADDYRDAYFAARSRYPHTYLHLSPERHRLVGQLNLHGARMAASSLAPAAIGYLGDDHRPRTVGWDTAMLAALGGTGIAYGDDLWQHENLPTAVVMSTDIVRTLGYMAPPSLVHMYCDNFWRDLGRAADCLTYLPDVVIEHLHPCTGKADWDDSYHDSNAPHRYAADRAAYEAYRLDQLDTDATKVRELLRSRSTL